MLKKNKIDIPSGNTRLKKKPRKKLKKRKTEEERMNKLKNLDRQQTHINKLRAKTKQNWKKV